MKFSFSEPIDLSSIWPRRDAMDTDLEHARKFLAFIDEEIVDIKAEYGADRDPQVQQALAVAITHYQGIRKEILAAIRIAERSIQ